MFLLSTSIHRSITSEMSLPSPIPTQSLAPPSQSSVPPRLSPTPTSSSSQRKRRKKCAADNLDKLLVDKLMSERDEASSFGEHVAACLQSFTPRQRAIACLEIDKVLLSIEFLHEVPFPPPQNMSFIPSLLNHNQSHQAPHTHSHGHHDTDHYPYWKLNSWNVSPVKWYQVCRRYQESTNVYRWSISLFGAHTDIANPLHPWMSKSNL